MKAMRGVQMAAKGVGEAFTGGRDLHQMLHALHSTTISVEAYFGQPSFARVLPDNLKQWAASLCGEAKEAYKRLKLRVEQMEKDGVRGAAESSLHALSSAAGAITGIAMLDVGRHIADELVQTTSALNDVLARATRLVTLANTAMLERLAEEKGLTIPTAMEVNPLLTKLEIENIRARIWVHTIEDGSVVAGDKVSVVWDTIGNVPLVNVRLKNCMGVETSRGKTVQRMTVEAGEPNKGVVHDILPLDFVPGKYTVAVSDPANNIRGMAFVSVLRPVSVAEIMEPATGMGRSLTTWNRSTWNRGTSHKISWRMNRGKANILTIAISISPTVEGPWRVLRGAAELKFKVPDADLKEVKEEPSSTHSGVDGASPRARRPVGENHADNSASDDNDDKSEVVWGPGSGDGNDEPEWFSERSKPPRTKAVTSSVGNTFAGFMSSVYAAGAEQASPPANRPKPGTIPPASALGFEVSDEYHLADTHCLDCSFDWFVPVEMEPGKYMFRVSPIGTNGNHRYTEKEQLLRSRDSAFVTIS